MVMVVVCIVFFFKQKTAYEMRISDWSSDVCSSDLVQVQAAGAVGGADQDRIEGAEADQEDRAVVLDPEQGDRERQPGGDRDRSQTLYGRVAQPGDHAAQAAQDRDRARDQHTQAAAMTHTRPPIHHPAAPRTATGLE